MLFHAQVGLHHHTSLTVDVRADLSANSGGLHACSPQDSGGADPFVVRSNTVSINSRYLAGCPYLNPQCLEIARSATRLSCGKHRKDPRSGLNENDLGKPRIDVAEILPKREAA